MAGEPETWARPCETLEERDRCVSDPPGMSADVQATPRGWPRSLEDGGAQRSCAPPAWPCSLHVTCIPRLHPAGGGDNAILYKEQSRLRRQRDEPGSRSAPERSHPCSRDTIAVGR